MMQALPSDIADKLRFGNEAAKGILSSVISAASSAAAWADAKRPPGVLGYLILMTGATIAATAAAGVLALLSCGLAALLLIGSITGVFAGIWLACLAAVAGFISTFAIGATASAWATQLIWRRSRVLVQHLLHTLMSSPLYKDLNERTMPHVLHMAEQMQRTIQRPSQQEQESGDAESTAVNQQQESDSSTAMAPPTPVPPLAPSEAAQQQRNDAASADKALEATSNRTGQIPPHTKHALKAQVPIALEGVTQLIPSAHI